MDAGMWFIQLKPWQVVVVGLIFFGGMYVLGAWAMAGLTRWLAQRDMGQVLDARPVPSGQLRREWRQSLQSVCIFGLGLLVPWGFLQLGWARLALHASAVQVVLEVIALLLWNDVHFWLNHRLLHTRRFIRYHGHHHRSVVTTPWSAYSFHPLEALLLGSVILLPMLLHNFSFWALAALPVLSLLLNLVGHSNWDFFPHLPVAHPLAASRRHHLHHTRPAGNYGFAFSFMDRLMGTRTASQALVTSPIEH